MHAIACRWHHARLLRHPLLLLHCASESFLIRLLYDVAVLLLLLLLLLSQLLLLLRCLLLSLLLLEHRQVLLLMLSEHSLTRRVQVWRRRLPESQRGRLHATESCIQRRGMLAALLRGATPRLAIWRCRQRALSLLPRSGVGLLSLVRPSFRLGPSLLRLSPERAVEAV